MSFPQFIDELELLVRSRYGLIVIDSWELDRADDALRHVAAQLSLHYHGWRRSKGLQRGAESGAPLIDDTALAQAVRRANLPLPDYARITRWTRGRAPFLAESGFATPNGRPRRSAIARDHAELLFPTSAAVPSTP